MITAEPIVAPPPGYYPDVPAEVYRAWPYACNSLLWAMGNTSPEHARHLMLNGGEDSDVKDKGSCVHAALLESGRFDEEYAIGPDVKLNTKAGKDEWEAFVAANPGRNHVRGADGVDLLAMRRRVWEHPSARKILRACSGPELSVVWRDEDTGVMCKARLDLPCPSLGVLADLKSTRSASRWKFAKSIREYGYFQQAAFYIEGAARLGVAFDQFAVIAVESAKPYGVAVFELMESDIVLGRNRFRQQLTTWAECERSGVWPGYPALPQMISMPRWGLDEDEE